MNQTFVFWLTALYTLAIFGVQLYEFFTGSPRFDFTTVNAVYLAFLSSYVGGKEAARWSKRTAESEDDPGPEPFRLPGEWFVGLWSVFLLVASILSQLWPAHFHYPHGLTTITFEVVGFYVGSSVSRWLKTRDSDVQEALDHQLSEAPKTSPSPETSPVDATRLSKKRTRYEEQILKEVDRAGHVTRPRVEALTGLSRAASLRILSDLVSNGKLTRAGQAGDTDTRYVKP